MGRVEDCKPPRWTVPSTCVSQNTFLEQKEITAVIAELNEEKTLHVTISHSNNELDLCTQPRVQVTQWTILAGQVCSAAPSPDGT